MIEVPEDTAAALEAGRQGVLDIYKEGYRDGNDAARAELHRTFNAIPRIYDVTIDEMRPVTQKDVELLEQRLAEKIAELRFMRKLFYEYSVRSPRDPLAQAIKDSKARR